MESDGGDTMTLESSTLPLKSLPITRSAEHGPTSAFNPDRGYDHNKLKYLYNKSKMYLVVPRRGNASRDYPEDMSFEYLKTLANHQSRSIDLLDHFNADLANKTRKASEIHQKYQIRITDLRNDAMLDGFDINASSEQDLWSFFESIPFADMAELVLLENGNLRAIWSDQDNNHLGIQFLGDGMAQYVIFRRRKGSSYISRVAGRDTIEGIKKQVRNFKLDAFLGS